ncbi:TIGR02302 family protein [Pseudooceanicola marinus]|uniref:TIGR02302 family protein n=1 Tax=Pseudooceanicola marinus TaxID=396013 RepID=UPI001CD6D696|nr:TIGR02302 family protein [Pseudooceanicola marinus]MCA1337593.1 TIGR02302 family protein [Pseudooceanicola marinus]
MVEPTRYTRLMHRLRWRLALTRAGILAESVVRALWPLWTFLLTGLALVMLGVVAALPVEAIWTLGALAGVVALALLVLGLRRLRFPSREDAFRRLDATLKGQPLQALRDSPAIGDSDPGTRALWEAHQARMVVRARQARAVDPDLRLSSRDPFGLRYVALLGVVVALFFGSFWRLGDLGDMTPGGAQAAIGPSWEGWVAPPPYTGLPTLYLGDIAGEELSAPRGSEVTVRFYGPEGRLELSETVSGRVGDLPPADASAQDFIIEQDGRLAVEGPGGREWRVVLVPDQAPAVTVDGPGEADVEGQMTMPFSARDDYGVVAGEAVIALDLDAVDRRYGLAMDPEPREAIRVPLPMPISGSRAEFSEALVENFSQHPWANMPVTVSLTVEDAAAQSGRSDGYDMLLDARRFFDPLAAALIEMRRDLLWNRDNAERVAQVLRAVRWQGDRFFPSETLELRLMRLVRKVETIVRFRPMTDEQVSEVTAALWDMAVEIEDGDLDDARARMERARDRLQEAMRNGASDEEIARLMQELRDATQDYMRQLAQQQARDRANDPNQPPMDMENAMRMTQDDIQRMMDRIQELMEEGRMAEAQQALEELQQMLENMQMTEGQGGGEGQQSPGEQAMEGLGETLRDQQELSDEAFRDLQDQFNPDGNSGQRGQQGQQGENQGQQQQGGQGQQQGQQPGQSQGGGGGQSQGQQQGQAGEGAPDAGDLADRQRQLREELDRQRGNLPGAGTEAGRAARDSLDRADEAMRGAEEALGEGDLAEAIDQQSQAMDALREGMRNLGEAMSQQERDLAGQQGEAEGDNPGQRNDPLGRNAGTNGALGNDREMLQDPDVQRRARDLLDEIRRRSGEAERSAEELDYLRRLLDRF